MITATSLTGVVVGSHYTNESFDATCVGFVFENCTFEKCNLSKEFLDNNLFIDCSIEQKVADTKMATTQAFVARLQKVVQ